MPAPKPYRLVFLLSGLLLAAGCKTITTGTSTSLIPPRLIEPLRFANFTVSDIHSVEGVSNLMTAKVYIGYDNPPPESYDWVRLSNQTDIFHAETIKEFKASIEHDFYDPTTQDRIRYEWFQSCAEVLDFMAKARPSKHSYLTGKYLMELPGSILMGSLSGEQEGELERDKLKGLRIRDYARSGQTLHLTHFEYQDCKMTFQDPVNEYDYVLKELARGDWDGDGNEDALILVGWHTQGTLGGSFTVMATKTGPDHESKWVALDSFLKCEPNIVKLVGTMKNETFPGPPNYKSIAKGDEPENSLVLKLDAPINAAEDPEYPVPDENSPILGVRDVQLNLDVHPNPDFAAYPKFLGKKVEVTGELTQGFTVHHKTAIMIWVREIKLAE